LGTCREALGAEGLLSMRRGQACPTPVKARPCHRAWPRPSAKMVASQGKEAEGRVKPHKDREM